MLASSRPPSQMTRRDFRELPQSFALRGPDMISWMHRGTTRCGARPRRRSFDLLVHGLLVSCWSGLSMRFVLIYRASKLFHDASHAIVCFERRALPVAVAR